MKTTESHMRKVLSPFEIRNRDAAGVEENIRNNEDAAIMQPLFSPRRRRTVGCFGQNFAIDPIAILKGDLVLQRGRDQDVAGDIPDRIGTWKRFSAGKVLDRARLFSEFVQLFNRQSLRVVYSRVPFRNADHLASVFLGEKFGGVIADVSKSLEDDSFAFETWRESQLLQVF